jgi:hypothetical protein
MQREWPDDSRWMVIDARMHRYARAGDMCHDTMVGSKSCSMIAHVGPLVFSDGVKM